MAAIVPEGLMRFVENTSSFSDYIGSARQETAQVMLDSFRECPLMGLGVGVPPTGYRMDGCEGPLNFELQYHLLLYRTGLIGTAAFLLPIGGLYLELFRKRGALAGSSVFGPRGKFRLALLLSALTTTIAAVGNPYLRTGYLMVVIASYWAYTHHLKDLGLGPFHDTPKAPTPGGA
jgi:hypothetical protein